MPTTGSPGSIVAVLASIEVKGRAAKSGYDRALFGTAWSDDVTVLWGHNGCDTRNDVLRRDLQQVVLKPDSHGCAVLSGTLESPYTATTIAFTRGSTNSSDVHIDHVVALADAWQKGAQGWSAEKRRNFANDPANLLATDGSSNLQKGEGDAATWLPKNRAFWCEYVARQTQVKAAYGLWMTAAEKERIGQILADCPTIDAASLSTPASAANSHQAPAGTTKQPPAASTKQPTAVSAPTPKPLVAQPTPSPTTPRTEPPAEPDPEPPAASADYRNCTEVWAALGGPIRSGDPGFKDKFDKDGDGVGCENRP